MDAALRRCPTPLFRAILRPRPPRILPAGAFGSASRRTRRRGRRPLGGALDLKAGDDIEENPLKRAIVLAASLVFVDPHELARAARAAARV